MKFYSFIRTKAEEEDLKMKLLPFDYAIQLKTRAMKSNTFETYF
jgi:hypothetical protein